MAIRKKTNVSPLDELTDQQRNLVRDGADAVSEYRDFSRRSFELWMRMARGVALLLDLADRRTSRSARRNLLREQGYGTLHPTICIKLRIMARHETAIRFWRDGLTQNQREKWNSPTSVCNRCPAVRKAYAEARADKPPRRPRAANKSVALERALDVISDYFNATEDADAKAVLRERLTSLTRAGEPSEPGEPCCSFCSIENSDDLTLVHNRARTAFICADCAKKVIERVPKRRQRRPRRSQAPQESASEVLNPGIPES
jgi:hypothetical protein